VSARSRRPGRAGPPGREPRVGAPGTPPGRDEFGGSVHPGGGGRGHRGDDGVGRRGLMRWLPVFRKEMRLYFGSPVAYVVFTFFLLISGWFFSQIFLIYSDISMRSFMQPQFGQNLNITDTVMRPLFTNMAVVLLFFIP